MVDPLEGRVVEQRVKFKTLLTRINRHLAKQNKRLCKARPNEIRTLGAYYLADLAWNTISEPRLDPIAFAAEWGILKHHEVVEVEAEEVRSNPGPIREEHPTHWPKVSKA